MHQFSSDNGLAMRRNISNVLCVIGAPLFGSTLDPRRSIAFRNSAGTWSRAPGKQFGVLGRWRDRHTRPARWSDTLRIRPVRWRKWNRIRIDLARLADPIETKFGIRKFKDSVYHSYESQSLMTNNFCAIFLLTQAQQPAAWDSWPKIYKPFKNFRSPNPLAPDEFSTNFEYKNIYGYKTKFWIYLEYEIYAQFMKSPE